MSLATTLMAVGIPAEQANRLGYEDRVPLDGNGTTQAGATEIIATNTNIAMGTSAGDTAFILPAEAELFQPYFLLNTTAETALIFPPVGDTIDANAVNTAVEIETDLARVFMRVEEGRWVSMPSGEGGGGIETIIAGAGISVDNTDPDNPIVSNTGVLSVTAGSNVSITGTAQDPIINADAAPVDSVNGQTGTVVLDAADVGAVATIVAGTNVTVDATDPQNPIVSASGGSGIVETVVAGTGIDVDATDPANPIVALDSAPDVRDYLDTAPYVATRTALKALDTTKDTVAILTESGREGVFVWRTGNYSARITADTQEGVYVKANAIASSSGAWVRQAADTPLWLASWFGALGDDSTDNATALAGVVSAFPSAGGVLLLGGGTFQLSALTLSKNINLTGLGGEGATTIKATATTGNVVTCSASGAGVTDILFTCASNRTSGAYIYAQTISRSHFTRNHFQKYYFGIDFDGAVVSAQIVDCDFRDGTPSSTATGGAGIRIGGATVNTDIKLDGVTMDAGASLMPSSGILLVNSDALQMVNCDIIHHGNCLNIAPGNSQGVAATYATNSYFDNASNGVVIQASGTGTVNRATFHGCWACSHSNTGFIIASAGGGLSMIQFVGCHGLFNASRGVLMNVAGGEVQVNGGFYNDNTVDGIAVSSGVDDFSIIGAQCRNNGAQGIWLVGTNDNYRIVGNDLRGNSGNALLGADANTSTKVIHSNVGVPEVVVSKQIATVQGSAVALTNNITTAQSVFAAANDTLTVLGATTYRFRAVIKLNTGATSHTTSFGLGGSATFTSIGYSSKATSSAASTVATTQQLRVGTAAATALTAASTAVTTDIEIEGLMRINAAGTIIPQITFSAGPTGTCEVAVNSFFELEPIGSNTVAAVGNWS